MLLLISMLNAKTELKKFCFLFEVCFEIIFLTRNNRERHVFKLLIEFFEKKQVRANLRVRFVCQILLND